MDGPNAGKVCRSKRLHGQRSMGPHIVAKHGPVGGVGAVDGDGDGGCEHSGGVPESAGDEQDFAGMEEEAHGDGLREKREFLQVGILDVRDLRGVVLIRLHVEKVSLIFGESGVLLDAVDLGEEGVSVVAVKMEEWEFGAFAADVELRGAVVQAGAQDAGQSAVEPVRKEITGQGRNVGEEFGEEAVDDFIAKVRSGI